MRTKMLRTEDWKPTKLTGSTFVCKHCESDNVYYRVDNLSNELCDICYDCHSCGHIWWIEGVKFEKYSLQTL